MNKIMSRKANIFDFGLITSSAEGGIYFLSFFEICTCRNIAESRNVKKHFQKWTLYYFGNEFINFVVSWIGNLWNH